MKQVVKASAEWRDLINKENLFLITFGFHWKQIHSKVTADVFGKKMKEELKVWTNRQRLVPGVESTPGGEPRSPKSADRVHGTSPLTRTQEPSLPTIAILTSAGATPMPTAGATGVVTTPPPMTLTTSAVIAGPSHGHPQVSRQEADDRLLAENLQEALREDDPMSFREMNASEESSTEGEEGDNDGENKGKGKAKMPTHRKVKAGGTGVPRVFYSSAGDEDKREEVGKSPALTLKIGQRPVKGTGEYFATPCHTCVRRNVSCEKTEGGPCVTCKVSKVKCSHVGRKQHQRRVVKTRPIISDSDFEPMAAAEVLAHKRSAAAVKVPKRVRKPVKVFTESSDEDEVLPWKKKARTQDGVPQEVEEVLGVLKGMSISHLPM